MPFRDEEKVIGPISLPDYVDLTPEATEQPKLSDLMGAAFRQENPIVSALSRETLGGDDEFDPEYNPWLDIQGTEYEDHFSSFMFARNGKDTAAIKRNIDNELADRRTLDAAGGMGFMAQMGAAILSPTSLLPGGAVVKGAKGVSIARTALTVSSAAMGAAAFDELMLQGSQDTRTGAESAFAIGGSAILGAALGSLAGKMGRAEFKRAGLETERVLDAMNDYVDFSYNRPGNSLSAASVNIDLTLRNEGRLQKINAIPVLRAAVRSDPVLRAQLSPLSTVRALLVDLVETPLQYAVNDKGVDVRRGSLSVEGAIKVREQTDMVKSLSYLGRSYAEYAKDGPVGVLGTLTAPVTTRFNNLMGAEKKLTMQEFMVEVGKAMRKGDKHPIPQVQSAADAMRREVFDRIKDEAIEVGLFDEDMVPKFADSYFTRVYNTGKIEANLGNGSGDDILPVIRENMARRRAKAEEVLANDRTVANLEADRFQQQETMRSAQRSLDTARQKARDKRGRAKAAITREGAVGRATGALRDMFQRRSDDLSARAMGDQEREVLRDTIKRARGADNREPETLLQAIRRMGGIKDPRVDEFWTRARYGRGGNRTELEEILQDSARTIRRNDGIDLDYMREALVEQGFMDDGTNADDLIDLIRQEASGEKVYSRFDADDVADWQALVEFRDAMEEAGIDLSAKLDDVAEKIARKVGGYADTSTTKAKAGEAGRSAGKAGAKVDAAGERVLKAMDRLDEANERLRYLDDEAAPRVREEIKAAREELKRITPELAKAKKAMSAEEYYAGLTDDDIADAAMDAVKSIIGLKPGQHSFEATMASPTRARALDIADVDLEPWLESNVEDIISHYSRSMVPLIEMMRKFGDPSMKMQLEDMVDEAISQMGGTPVRGGYVAGKLDDLLDRVGVDKQKRSNKKIIEELKLRIEDMEGMRDRLLNRYGVPENPKNGWIVGMRTGRTLSYTGYLGGMMLSAIPDVAGIVGRAGLVDAPAAIASGIMEPRKLFSSLKEMQEYGAAAEWFLNSRAMAIGEMFDPYRSASRIENVLGQTARGFSVATGMIPWNVGWKSIGGVAVASKMAKAAEAVRAGKATAKQIRTLAENGIEPWMAERIAKQIDAYGDKGGITWFPNGAAWDDKQAFEAFRHAMNREFDLMVITPGQDKPRSMSTETGKFFAQFKSFGFSAHHRILLSGIQRADADVLAQFATAVALGGLVSNIKADLGGYERKDGSVFWEDALDRSGLMGWLMEPYNALGAITAGRTAVGGEPVSRFQARSTFQGAAGPSVDMAQGVVEAINGFASGKATYRDVRKLMRPIPGSNLFYLQGLWQKVEDEIVESTGAKARPR